MFLVNKYFIISEKKLILINLYDIWIVENSFENPFLMYINNQFECENCKNKISKKQQVNDLSVEMRNNSQGFNIFNQKSVNNLNWLFKSKIFESLFFFI